MVRERKVSKKQSLNAASQVIARARPFVSTKANKLLPAVYVGFIFLAFVVGVLWQKVEALGKVTTNTNTNTQPVAQATPVPISLDQVKNLFSKDVIKFGDANRKLLFVAVEDPSCPYCHAASGKNPELNDQIGPQFKLVSKGGAYIAPIDEMRKLVDKGVASLAYVYMPGHGNGEMGQKALYCAYEKGRFWQVHDLLYSSKGYELQNTTVLNDKSKSQIVADFLKSAVDPTFLKSCLDSGKYDARLASDTQIAAEFSVTGTPGFFINSTRFAGAYSFKDMEGTVNAALN